MLVTLRFKRVNYTIGSWNYGKKVIEIPVLNDIYLKV